MFTLYKGMISLVSNFLTTPMRGKDTRQPVIILTMHAMADRHTIMENPPQHVIITIAISGISAAYTRMFRSHDHVGYTRNTGVANTHQATKWC